MTHVIFNKETTVYLRYYVKSKRRWMTGDSFKSEAAAKACLTKLSKKGVDVSIYQILPIDDFKVIEKQEVVHSMMTGAPVTQSVNTPNCCDPSSETYWSM